MRVQAQRLVCVDVQEMKRILFIFAKLNPGLRYVQGMNELLAPLYYHFRCDCDKDAASHAEPDAFFCFMDIISEFRDNFCQQLVRLSIPQYLSKEIARHVNPSRRGIQWRFEVLSLDQDPDLTLRSILAAGQ